MYIVVVLKVRKKFTSRYFNLAELFRCSQDIPYRTHNQQGVDPECHLRFVRTLIVNQFILWVKQVRRLNIQDLLFQTNQLYIARFISKRKRSKLDSDYIQTSTGGAKIKYPKFFQFMFSLKFFRLSGPVCKHEYFIKNLIIIYFHCRPPYLFLNGLVKQMSLFNMQWNWIF